MNNQNYRDMVENVCEQLPGNWQRIGTRMVKQLPNLATVVGIALQFPAGDLRQGMQIFYRQRDAYIMGYRTANAQSYATHNQLANVAGAIDLGYNDDYAVLGWNRQGPSVNTLGGPVVDVPTLDQALTSAAAGRATAAQLGRIVVALAEGVRFIDVERAVRGALPITTAMVDWNQQLAAGVAALRQG